MTRKKKNATARAKTRKQYKQKKQIKMAKRTKGRKRQTHRRRSRVSGIGAIDTQNVLGVALGAVGAKLVDKVVGTALDAKIIAGGKVAIGIALPMLVKDGKTKNMLAGVGSGMLAVGTVELLNAFGMLAGVGAKEDDMLVVSLEGVDDISVVNGEDDIRVINGTEDTTVLAGEETVLGDLEISEVSGIEESDMDTY